MKLVVATIVSALGWIPSAAWAQKWEIGAVGGGSFYTSADVKRGNATAEAGFKPGFAAGFVLGQEMGRYWGGEIRYLFGRNDTELSGPGGKATFGAQSHAIHYDFLLHFSPAGQRVRPFVSFGAGVRQYRGTGSYGITQPSSEFALLTRANDVQPMPVFGVGVKVRVGKRVNFRAEFKDYLTPLPDKLIQPNAGASVSGWIHNFVPLVGISYVF